MPATARTDRFSSRPLGTEVVLANGVGTSYGLGVNVTAQNGRRLLSHGGEVSGFTAQNAVYPDDRVAIVVQVNLDASSASGQIANRIATALFAAADNSSDAAVKQMREIFTALQDGRIDRSRLTANANAYFSTAAIADFASGLKPLGAPKDFTALSQGLRGGMTVRRFQIKFEKRTLSLTTFTMPDELIEQYQIAAVD